MTGLNEAKRVVVKVGSALLVDETTGHINEAWLAGLAQDIAQLKAQGKEVVIVTSGAVALGRKALNTSSPYLPLEEKQAAAACGQIILNDAWKAALGSHHIAVAQILITSDDTQQRKRYLNARNTINTLLRAGIIPVINENDSITTAEIRYGDNDRLSARVAAMISADLLVVLSDVDGLYDRDPNRHDDAKHIPEIRNISDEIRAMAGDDTNPHGTGGMRTKLMAAEIALAAGCHMVITQGTIAHPIAHLQQGGACSWFIASDTPLSARKHWIAATNIPAGTVMIDDGAVNALRQGKSLLPAGVTDIHGRFDRGDTVVIHDANGQELGKGLINYATDDAMRILGKKSGDIASILGYKGRDVLIHRDDMVLNG